VISDTEIKPLALALPAGVWVVECVACLTEPYVTVGAGHTIG